MNPPRTKAEWRRRAAALDPVPSVIAAQVTLHVEGFVARLVDEADEGVVLGYSALPDEIALGPTPGTLALPRLDDDGGLTIHLAEGIARERHRHGFEQPPAGLVEVDPRAVAAVLVPGRLFDRDGYRLGRGGGHYDRLVPRLAPGTPVVGVTCRARIVDALPRDPHDRPMTHLATEDGITPL